MQGQQPVIRRFTLCVTSFRNICSAVTLSFDLELDLNNVKLDHRCHLVQRLLDTGRI